MKGRKIRIVENPLYVETIRAFGGNPVPMAWPEVYSALQQKAIDGVETNYHGMANAKQYEVATDLAVTNHIFTSTVFLMNGDVFNSLSEEHQDVILKAARAGGETMRDGARKANEDAIALMEANGIAISRPIATLSPPRRKRCTTVSRSSSAPSCSARSRPRRNRASRLPGRDEGCVPLPVGR